MGIIEPLKRVNRTILKNVKVTPEEERIIQENADKFAGGNVSEWIRYSAMKLKPKKKYLPNNEVKDDSGE